MPYKSQPTEQPICRDPNRVNEEYFADMAGVREKLGLTGELDSDMAAAATEGAPARKGKGRVKKVCCCSNTSENLDRVCVQQFVVARCAHKRLQRHAVGGLARCVSEDRPQNAAIRMLQSSDELHAGALRHLLRGPPARCHPVGALPASLLQGLLARLCCQCGLLRAGLPGPALPGPGVQRRCEARALCMHDLPAWHCAALDCTTSGIAHAAAPDRRTRGALCSSHIQLSC